MSEKKRSFNWVSKLSKDAGVSLDEAVAILYRLMKLHGTIVLFFSKWRKVSDGWFHVKSPVSQADLFNFFQGSMKESPGGSARFSVHPCDYPSKNTEADVLAPWKGILSTTRVNFTSIHDCKFTPFLV